ncbi:MAG: GntR family transcriptional regulator [Nitrospinae bacterium]|nr:GntR family transcriptional regulator [Nitrospinota bacterium]
MRIPGVQIEKPKSLSKMVSEQIKDAILSGIFQPGDKLVETTLTESMGVRSLPGTRGGRVHHRRSAQGGAREPRERR